VGGAAPAVVAGAGAGEEAVDPPAHVHGLSSATATKAVIAAATSRVPDNRPCRGAGGSGRVVTAT
jgi:hypothetical protein